MIAFFRSFNLARAIILFSLIGSAYLAWADWNAHQELKMLRQVFPTQVGKIMRDIQREAKLHSKLSEDFRGDQFIGEQNMESYIRTIYDGLNMGEANMNPTDSEQRGFTDRKEMIKPSDSKRAFGHYEIARFLYELERQSRQIKVTSIKMDLQGQRPKQGEIPADAWTFTAEVTNRVKNEQEASGPNAASR